MNTQLDGALFLTAISLLLSCLVTIPLNVCTKHFGSSVNSGIVQLLGDVDFTLPVFVMTLILI